MGFLSAYDGTHRITIPHPDKDYWVVLRKHLPHGATERSTAALQTMSIVGGKPCPAPDVYKSHSELVHASIVEWNLDDDNGTVWPLNMQSVRRLPEAVFDLLHDAVLESNKTRSVEEQRRFPGEGVVGDPVGDSGPAEPVDVPAAAGTVAAPWGES